MGSICSTDGGTKHAYILFGKHHGIKALETPIFRPEDNITIDLTEIGC